ncbi:Modulator of drug activity B [compost metagenome]
MNGKKFMVAATWNAPEEAFDNKNGVLFGGKNTDDLLLHITSNYKFVGFDILSDYGVFDIFKESSDISESLKSYIPHLEEISLNV